MKNCKQIAYWFSLKTSTPFCFQLPTSTEQYLKEIKYNKASKYRKGQKTRQKINRKIGIFMNWNLIFSIAKIAEFNLFSLFANIKAKLNKNIIFQITPLDLLIYASVSISYCMLRILDAKQLHYHECIRTSPLSLNITFFCSFCKLCYCSINFKGKCLL